MEVLRPAGQAGGGVERMMVAWRGLLCCCVWKKGGMDETVVSGPVEYDLLHVQTRISSAYGYARVICCLWPNKKP